MTTLPNTDALRVLHDDLEKSFIAFLGSDPQRTTSVPATMAARQFMLRFEAYLKQHDQARLTAILAKQARYHNPAIKEGIDGAYVEVVPVEAITAAFEAVV